MSCRCAERAQAIRSAAKALTRGDASKIAPAAHFVVATMAQDAKTEAARIRAMLRRK